MRVDFLQIPIHYDVEGHTLAVEQFIAAAQAAKTVLSNLNEVFFDGSLHYELFVAPPEAGTFFQKLGIKGKILVLSAGAFTFLESDIGKSFISGLTDQEPAYYAKVLGKKIKQQLAVDETELAVSIAPNILATATVGFLKKPNSELRSLGLNKGILKEAYASKSEFYRSCFENPQIRGIEFDNTGKFPIKRQDFLEYAMQVALIPEAEEDVDWQVEIKDVIVNSPNWVRDSTRQWQARCDDDPKVWFRIEDDYFWHHVRLRDINPQINDRMTVQWAYPGPRSGHRTHVRVLRVLSYNGQHLSDPLNQEELEVKLGNILPSTGIQTSLL